MGAIVGTSRSQQDVRQSDKSSPEVRQSDWASYEALLITLLSTPKDNNTWSQTESYRLRSSVGSNPDISRKSINGPIRSCTRTMTKKAMSNLGPILFIHFFICFSNRYRFQKYSFKEISAKFLAVLKKVSTFIYG